MEGLTQLMALSAPIKWSAKKEMQNFRGLQESERSSRKMKGQETNSATCEISQVAKFRTLRNFIGSQVAKFRNLEISRLKNYSSSPLQHLQKPKIIRRHA